MKHNEGDTGHGEQLDDSRLESFHEHIRRVGVEAPPGGQFYVQSHHSYGLPRWYHSEDQRDRLLAAADRVIERLKAAPDEYWAELEGDAMKADDADFDAALASPEVRRMLGRDADTVEPEPGAPHDEGGGEATD